jgi:hypothetical protein
MKKIEEDVKEVLDEPIQEVVMSLKIPQEQDLEQIELMKEPVRTILKKKVVS